MTYFSIYPCGECGNEGTTMLDELQGKFHCLYCGRERWATSKSDYKKIDKKFKKVLGIKK